MMIDNLKKEIDLSLEKYFHNKGGYNKVIYESMAYSINIGGKRIRPILMLLTYKMYQSTYNDIMPMACAMEMIHTYSLIHDDLPCMDDDDLRRGKPTNHKVFGEAIAVLAGDGLLNEAMNIMFDFSMKNKQGLEAANVISKSAGADGMIGGQIVDIINEGKKIAKEELDYMHAKKTGELITASVLSGAILGEAPISDRKELKAYGQKLGLAFQIKDDILDVTATTETLGKNAGSDIDNEKSNYISMYGIELCQNICEKLTEECITHLSNLSVDSADLKELTYALLNREY